MSTPPPRIDSIHDKVAILIGQPLSDSWRIPDLTIQVFEFGPQLPYVNHLGKNITRSMLAIHVSCAWRLIDQFSLVVGADDYEDEPSGNKLDRLMSQYFATVAADDLVVESVECDQIGGIVVKLTGSRRLEIVPCETGDAEWWRIVPLGTESQHFVVDGNMCYTSEPGGDSEDTYKIQPI